MKNDGREKLAIELYNDLLSRKKLCIVKLFENKRIFRERPETGMVYEFSYDLIEFSWKDIQKRIAVMRMKINIKLRKFVDIVREKL